MTIQQIFDTYTKGSQGFVIAAETHLGIDCSRDEIERIALAATGPEDFMRIWADEDFWTDAKSA